MMEKQKTIKEIDSMMKDLKKIKRKLYCADYYKTNKDKILKHMKELKNRKTPITDKEVFKIEKQKITIHFD